MSDGARVIMTISICICIVLTTLITSVTYRSLKIHSLMIEGGYEQQVLPGSLGVHWVKKSAPGSRHDESH